jgi:hypothetical protein
MTRRISHFIIVAIVVSFPAISRGADHGPIISGQTKTGTLSSPGFSDSWTFAGKAGDRVVITSARITGSLEPEIYLYPPAGGTLEASSVGLSYNHTLDHRLLQTGVYTIIISDWLLDEDGQYGVALATMPGVAFSATDPDGGPISSGGNLSGTLVNHADTDLYQFYGQAGDRVVITAARITESIEPQIYLYPPSGGALEASSVGLSYDHWLDHQLQQTGVYTILVSDWLMDEDGQYGIALARMPGGTTTDSDADGGLVTSGASLTGTLSYNADTDMYQLYGQAGDRVVITAARITGSIEPQLYLYPPGGGIAEASSVGLSYDHRIDHQLLQTGLYTVLISDWLLDEDGQYGVSVTKIPSDLRPGVYNPVPADQSTITSLSGSFSWDAVPGATGYDLYFGEDLTAPLAKIGDNLASPTLSFPAMQSGRYYYWHIVAHTVSGDIQGSYWWLYYPDTLLPGVASLASPFGAITSNTPTYTWQAVPNASWYFLWVNDSGGAKIQQWYTDAQADCASGVGTCSVTPATALIDGPATWWIQTWNAHGYGPWSTGMGFAVNASPGAAGLISPSGVITESKPTYTWNSVPGATWYYLWVNDSSGTRVQQWYESGAAGCHSGTGACSVKPDTGLASGNATWWVQTWNSAGFGSWSGAMSFAVNPAAPPEAAIPLVPFGAVSSAQPAYIWSAVFNASWYYLWVNDATGTKVQQWFTAAQAGCALGTGACSVTPSVSLANGAVTWWVQTWNMYGPGPWSGGMGFAVNSPPGAAVLLSPAGVIPNNKPTYLWNAVPGSTWYYLWVNDTSGVKITQWYTAEAAGCTTGVGTCSVTPGTALANGSGMWWIQTWNLFGLGPWSSGMGITVSSALIPPLR